MDWSEELLSDLFSVAWKAKHGNFAAKAAPLNYPSKASFFFTWDTRVTRRNTFVMTLTFVLHLTPWLHGIVTSQKMLTSCGPSHHQHNCFACLYNRLKYETYSILNVYLSYSKCRWIVKLFTDHVPQSM